MEKSPEHLEKVLEDFQLLTKKPEIFLNCDDSFAESIKFNMKQTYDFSKLEEIKVITGALPELLIKNFDTEQIWQEIELQNNSILGKSLKNISTLLIKKDKLMFPTLQKDLTNTDMQNKIERNESDESKIQSELEDEIETADSQKVKGIDDNQSPENTEDEMDLGDIESEEEIQENTEKVSNKRKSGVEDDFFKLDEMENFLNSEEKKMDAPDSGNNSEESQSEAEGSIDLFQDESDGDEETKTARFKDFFRPNEESKKVKRNKFLEDMSDTEDAQTKSTLELRQERLKRRIDEFEQAAISEKPWPLKGEIVGDNRPVNSLLEEVVEFDLTSRPAPIITEKTTLQLEDIIRQRIKDKVFDSVERKAKPIETPLEYKKKLVLDQEKSKHSLAQIYEKEYLEKQSALDPDNADKKEEEPELHKEVKTMMVDLFNKLDALSNFHFTPKPAIPELRIVSNLPAFTMEEVAPVTASDAVLLAPEEVCNKPRGDIIGKTERTRADKNRERRKKKQKQKYHSKNKQINKNMLVKEKNHKDKSTSGKPSKNNSSKKMDETSKSLKSSKAFFSELQEQVQSHISDKVADKKRKKNKNQIEAKRIKL